MSIVKSDKDFLVYCIERLINGKNTGYKNLNFKIDSFIIFSKS